MHDLDWCVSVSGVGLSRHWLSSKLGASLTDEVGIYGKYVVYKFDTLLPVSDSHQFVGFAAVAKNPCGVLAQSNV